LDRNWFLSLFIEKFAIIDKNNKMLQTSLRRSLKTPQKDINSNFSIENSVGVTL